VEDDTMDRRSPGRLLTAPRRRSRPRRSIRRNRPSTLTGNPPCPTPATGPLEQPERPRGRHEATRRRSLGGPAGMAIAVVVASVVFAGVLATWLISSAEEAPDPAPAGEAAAATTVQGGPTSRPLGPGSFGNLVVNWSFEQDLSGWQVLGEADGSREPQGRTSGSCASVRARGPEPGQSAWSCPRSSPRPGRASGIWPRPGCVRAPPVSR
jgi:hypothetical protein